MICVYILKEGEEGGEKEGEKKRGGGKKKMEIHCLNYLDRMASRCALNL